MHFLYTRSCIVVTFTALLCNTWSHTDIWFCSLGFQTTNVLQLVLLKSNARHVLGYGDVTALVTLLVECRSTGDWLYANNYWYTLHRQWDGEYSHTSPLLKWKVSTALYLNLECSFGDIILFDGDQVLSTSLIVMCLSWVFGNDHVLLTLLIVGYLSLIYIWLTLAWLMLQNVLPCYFTTVTQKLCLLVVMSSEFSTCFREDVV